MHPRTFLNYAHDYDLLRGFAKDPGIEGCIGPPMDTIARVGSPGNRSVDRNNLGHGV